MAQSPASYDGVSLSYKNNSWVGDGGDGFQGINGFGVDYVHGFSIVDALPLYLEAGAGLSLGLDSQGGAQLTLLDLKVPVNVTYAIDCGNSFSIRPFAGINAKCYLLGRESIGDEGINLLSKDEMGAVALSSFHIGWQAGANFQYKNIWLGVSYGTDFTEVVKNTKTHWSRFAVSVGFKF